MALILEQLEDHEEIKNVMMIGLLKKKKHREDIRLRPTWLLANDSKSLQLKSDFS